MNSYARINHPHTKTWLVAQKGECLIKRTCVVNIIILGEQYKRESFNPEALGLASLQWDSAELLKIGVQDHMSYDDVFTVEKVVMNIYVHTYMYYLFV